MKMKKRLLGLVLTVAMVVTMALPLTASAESAWDYPTEPMAIDDNIVKVGIIGPPNYCTPLFGAQFPVYKIA